jgi:hypothetical protein
VKNEDDPFDLEKLRLNPEDVRAYVDKARAAPSARRPSGRQFTMVPAPCQHVQGGIASTLPALEEQRATRPPG